MDLAVVKDDLRNFLSGAQRIAIVGIGQGYRQDDAVGIIVVENLFMKLSGGQVPPLSLYETEFPTTAGIVKLYQGYETPENLTGRLRKFLPTHVLFIDAAQLAEEPGTLELVPISEVQGETLSTHDLPLSVLGEFLEKDMGSKVALLGIQPLSIGIGPEKSLSEPVGQAASAASELIAQVLKEQI
jgi:hydrogenase 3 maturation protease